MRFSVGCSEYDHAGWRGSFYPREVPTAGWLSYYGEQLAAVEIKKSLPWPPQGRELARWTAQVPDNFRFSIRAPSQTLQHPGLADPDGIIVKLFNATTFLEQRLGPIVFDVPATADVSPETIGQFLEDLPDHRRVAFSFEDASMLSDPICKILPEYRAACCITDDKAHSNAAGAGWGYLKFSQESYEEDELRDWSAHIRAQSWDEVYAIFGRRCGAAAPKFAGRLANLLADA